MKIKNRLFLLIIVLVSVACATQHNFSQKVLDNVNIDKITSADCKAEGMWSVPVMGTSTTVVVYKQCVGVKKLSMVVVDASDSFSIKLDVATADLINMRYVHYLNYSNTDKSHMWVGHKIKTQSLTAEKSPTGRLTHIVYYSLTFVPVE